MCIRDRSKKDRTRQQMEEAMRQLRKVFMTVRLMKADEVQGGKKGSAPCYAPVSYTHLDVYKRQIYSTHNSALAGGFVRFADTSSTKKTRAVQALSA